ncbi:MAG: hypothetical protein V3T26_05900 [candidate division NC10 bacterium]
MDDRDSLILEQHLIVGMYAHRAATYKYIAAELLDEAGRRWSQGETEVATFLRDVLVGRYEDRAGVSRQEQTKARRKLEELEANEEAAVE